MVHDFSFHIDVGLSGMENRAILLEIIYTDRVDDLVDL